MKRSIGWEMRGNEREQEGAQVRARRLASPRLKATSLGVAAYLALFVPYAHAGKIVNCSSSTGNTYASDTVSGSGSFGPASVSSYSSCNSGVYLSDESATGAAVWVGNVGGLNANQIGMYASGGVLINGNVDMLSHTITGLAAGTVSSTSTDAVNGAQLFSFSTSTS
ncbi:TPA: hypothetical protein QDB10_006123, partial [Burkholderia vietnamiensis]|nr:hypothetical protein [Burkholderia vietnamiensis]